MKQLGLTLMRSLAFSIFVISMSFTSGVMAELRVLMVFDSAGHRVHRVQFSDSGESRSVQSIQSSLNRAASNIRLDDSSVTVQWLDSAGQILMSESLQDPRLQHAPVKSHENDSADVVQERTHIAMIHRTDGVYLLKGPDLASEILLILPSVQAGLLLLPAERWAFNVTQP